MMKCTSFEDEEDMTGEPLKNICNALPEILEDFLYTRAERNLKRKILNLYF